MTDEKDQLVEGPEAAKILREGFKGVVERTLAAAQVAVEEVQKAEAEAKARLLQKVTPPGISEDLAHKIKREYKGDKSKAYATMWAIKNKKTNKSEGLKKAVSVVRNMAGGTTADKIKPEAPKPENSKAPELKKNTMVGGSYSGGSMAMAEKPKLPGLTPATGMARPGGYKLPGMRPKKATPPPVPTSAARAGHEMKGFQSIASNPTAMPGGKLVKAEMCKSCNKEHVPGEHEKK